MIRAADSDDDIIAVHKLLMVMGNEVAREPVDPIMVMEHIVGLVRKQGGAVLMAFHESELAGVLGLQERHQWWTRSTFLADAPLYVLPEYRNTDVFPALLQEARAIGDMVKQRVVIVRNNPNRRPKRADHVASLIGYSPFGDIYAFYPR